ncbi:MAG: hypothetical protein IT307_03600 [Chloroflexi bacterium]|nr:hypothetical protein [Chloroflexota bacterium]
MTQASAGLELATSPRTIVQLASDLKRLASRQEQLQSQLLRSLSEAAPLWRRAAGAVGRVLPRSLAQPLLRASDPLVVVERMLRGHLDEAQSVLGQIAMAARVQHEEIAMLQSDLTAARREDWSLDALRRFMAERAGFPIRPDVAELLAREESELLDAEMRSARREEVLSSLEQALAVERTVLDALGETARHSIRMLERGLSQYHAYVRVAPQVRMLREAAAEMAGTQAAGLAAREVLLQTLEASADRIRLLAETSQQAEPQKLTSPESRGRFRRVYEELRAVRGLLHPSVRSGAVSPPDPVAARPAQR